MLLLRGTTKYGQQILVGNLHACYGDEQLRKEEIHAARRILAAEKSKSPEQHVVLAGDFNATAEQLQQFL
jgi:endonuclease/exonuclease/phosphatase family metal-dependent hydrolase